MKHRDALAGAFGGAVGMLVLFLVAYFYVAPAVEWFEYTENAALALLKQWAGPILVALWVTGAVVIIKEKWFP